MSSKFPTSLLKFLLPQATRKLHSVSAWSSTSRRAGPATPQSPTPARYSVLSTTGRYAQPPSTAITSTGRSPTAASWIWSIAAVKKMKVWWLRYPEITEVELLKCGPSKSQYIFLVLRARWQSINPARRAKYKTEIWSQDGPQIFWRKFYIMTISMLRAYVTVKMAHPNVSACHGFYAAPLAH